MSRYEAEPEPGSSRTTTVVLLSLLILAVIGALFGYVLGQRDIDESKSSSGDGPSAVPATGSTRRGPSFPPSSCPGFISQGVKAQDRNASVTLYLVQYIRTKNREVWICRESDGSGLWYQGHDKRKDWYESDGGEIPVEGDNGLLRPGVTTPANRTYVLKNDNTTYTVTPDALTVTGGQTYTEPAVQANPAP
ncbi:hypothetical protein [Dactylosporangium sp. CA-092794]|uniref:hypothetical protein n=1 Tax=Dactylosporangium sp. CA-092794 TaxID=3239929 RepID=UPI003D91717A